MKLPILNNDRATLSSDIKQIIDTESADNSWLKDIRLKALSNFIDQPFPNRKTEHWKYNDMSFLGSEASISEKTSDIPTFSTSYVELDEPISLALVSGRYSQQLSPKVNEKGISVTNFADANKEQIEIISSSLEAAKQNKNSLIHFSTSISQNGLLIEIEDNIKIERPIYIHNANYPADNSTILPHQVVIHCGSNSQCQIVEHFTSIDERSGFFLQQSIIYMSDNSQVDYSRINLDGAISRQVNRVLFLLQKRTVLQSFYYSEGSQLNKTDIDVYHQGEHSESQITGIYLPSENKVVDYHLNVEHQVANCTSREAFRGIIADSAKATFNGKIHIFKDAQKSDAQLSNKNLLLTNQAEINTKPELEIYADDVVCAHGATVAKIDDKAIYYLQTRGIDKTRAKKMLSIGFINELLEQVKNKELNSFLTERVQTCLSDIK